MYCPKDACLVLFWLESRADLLEVIVNRRSHVLNLIQGLVICLLKGFAFLALLLEVFLQFSSCPLTAGKILLHQSGLSSIRQQSSTPYTCCLEPSLAEQPERDCSGKTARGTHYTVYAARGTEWSCHVIEEVSASWAGYVREAVAVKGHACMAATAA